MGTLAAGVVGLIGAFHGGGSSSGQAWSARAFAGTRVRPRPGAKEGGSIAAAPQRVKPWHSAPERLPRPSWKGSEARPRSARTPGRAGGRPCGSADRRRLGSRFRPDRRLAAAAALIIPHEGPTGPTAFRRSWHAVDPAPFPIGGRARKVAWQADLRARVHAKSLAMAAVRNASDLAREFANDLGEIDTTGRWAEDPELAAAAAGRSERSTISCAC